MNQPYRVAGIDVHKKMLAVVVADVAGGGEFAFQRRKFGTLDSDLTALSEWLAEQGVREAVMESTGQYGKPVWRQLEEQLHLHLAQAQSHKAPRGRKQDFRDAERLVRRWVAGELILSFVPDPQQRLWRTLTRTKYQLTRDRVRLQNQLESLLEDARLKLDACGSDLLGVSSLRMLRAIAKGESDPAALAALADPSLRATPEQRTDALRAVSRLSPLHRQILQLFLDRLDLMEQQIQTWHEQIAQSLQQHQPAVVRLAQIPGLGIDSAQQIIAEVGPTAATFPTPEQFSSWAGVCPGREESAEVSKSDRTPKGSKVMRRLLSQLANAAVKSKGSVFQLQYRRLIPRMGHNKAIWAVAHRLCRVVWIVLHRQVDYIEYGPERNQRALQRRTLKMLRLLRGLGYQCTPPLSGGRPA